MHFTIRDTIPYPRDRVFDVQRDEMPNIAPYLDRVESIIVQERREEGNVVHLVNLWKASGAEIPKIAQSFIKPELMQWIDRAVWDRDAFTCSWDMELGFLPGAIDAHGQSTWIADGDQTVVEIQGQVIIHANKIPGVPRLVAGKVGTAIEKFVVTTIEPNLRKTGEGVRRYLESSG